MTQKNKNPMKIETEREEDSRWIAEVPDLPGVMVYGDDKEDAILKVKVLVLRVIADRIEHGEEIVGVQQSSQIRHQ